MRRSTRISAGWRVNAPRWTFLLLLVLGPVCFGATETWSLLMLETGAVAVFLLWVAASWRHVQLEIDLPTLVLVLFGLLVEVQRFTTTVYSYATEQELLKISAYFLLFILARQLFQSHQHRSLLVNVLVLFGGAYALFAIAQKLQGNGYIYWMRATSTNSFLGAYANKNHYAGLMEMLLPFALISAAKANSGMSMRALSAFLGSVMTASVFLSGSRTGILVIVIELMLFASLMLRSRERLISRVSIAISIAGVALVIWIAGSALANQVSALGAPATQASLFNRLQVFRDSIELVRQRPILGWGLGTFPIVYPPVATWYSDFVVNAAHNDYLQLLVESGTTGLALLLLFLVVVFHAGARRLFDVPSSTIAAALLGCIGLLLHSFTDFNLHVPANAAIFFALCGMICAASKDGVPAS